MGRNQTPERQQVQEQSFRHPDPLDFPGFWISPLDFPDKLSVPMSGYWSIGSSGYMTYGIRTTAGNPVAVLPTKVKIGGIGSWYHSTFDRANQKSDTFAGTAVVNIRMGEVKYQRSEYFSDFFE